MTSFCKIVVVYYPLVMLTILHFIIFYRVNPIFIEEGQRENTKCVCSGDQGKSGSSGYESQRSNSEWSVEEDRGATRLREDSVAILEQNTGFVKSILVAVRGGPTLSPIPEGKIDYCIPRPVWPRYEHRQRKPPSVRTVDTGLRVNKTARVHRKTQRKTIQNRQMESTGIISEERQKTTCDLLRELSNTISLAVDRKDRSEVSAEEVLRNIGQTISKSLEALSSEAALRRLSVSLSRSEAVATVGRALSNSGSSTDGYDLEAGRLSLLKRLGRFPPNEPLYDHPHGSSSSSAASSSGFSDLTPTPPSSSSSRPLGPVFVHENPASVSNSVRNAMIYGTLQCRGTKGSGYEKLGGSQSYSGTQDSQWTTFEQNIATPEKTQTEICVSNITSFDNNFDSDTDFFICFIDKVFLLKLLPFKQVISTE